MAVAEFGVRACLALPFRVRSIELDLRAVTEVSEDARQILLALVRAWRQARRGHVAILASETTLGFFGEPSSSKNAPVSARPEPNRLDSLTAAAL